MSKILIDEAVVRQTLEALDYWRTSPETCGFTYKARDVTTALRQALADAALDKMADNARDMGLSYEQPAPAQPWVGLTDEEIYEAGHLKVEGERMLPFSFARAIEAKLKEKNK